MLLNKSRAEQVMDKYGLDALVATTPENVAYLTGFWILTSLRHRARQVYAVITRKEMAADMVVSRGLVDHPLQGNCWARRFYTYGEFFFAPEYPAGMDAESTRLFKALDGLPRHENAAAALVKCLKDRGVDRGRVGVDQGSDVIFLGDLLAKEIPGLEIKAAYDIFREIRILKTPEEVHRIQVATAVAEKALAAAIATIGEGVTEGKINGIFREIVVREGGIPTLTCVGSGPRGAFPNVEPSERRVQKGDLVRFDVGCIFDAYHTDISRTAVLGQPNPKQKKYIDALIAAQGRILESLTPGAVISDLFRMGMAEARKKGIPHYERHHLGHGTGIEGYDLPLITPNNPLRLEPGMVFCVEAPYYEPGFGGLQIEDIVEITAGGSRQLTRMDRKLFVV